MSNFRHFSGLTAAAALLAVLALPLPVFSAGQPGASLVAAPLAVAQSEQFEAVGRLETEGLVWFIDRADSNAPVLDATLEVEANGKSLAAVYRPERGDYLIADPAWLQALRQEGEHSLLLTLVAGNESDLLDARLDVHVDTDTQVASGMFARWQMVSLAALALGVSGAVMIRRRRGAQK